MNGENREIRKISLGVRVIKTLGLAMSINKPLTKSSFIINHWKYFSRHIRVGPGDLSSTKPRPVCRQDDRHQAGVGRRPQAGTSMSISQGAWPGSVTTISRSTAWPREQKMKDRNHECNPVSRSTGSNEKKRCECQDSGTIQTKLTFWERNRACFEGSRPTLQTQSGLQCPTQAAKKY